MDDTLTKTDNGTEVKSKKESPEAKKAAEWLLPIIESCTNTFHLRCCGILVRQFKEIYYEKYGGKLYYEQLTDKVMERMNFLEVV